MNEVGNLYSEYFLVLFISKKIILSIEKTKENILISCYNNNEKEDGDGLKKSIL